MLQRKPSFIQVASFLTGGLILFLALCLPTTIYADGPAPDNSKCVVCHEDLYFLHDTGKWFCLKDSPMKCVDCHGGNPNTLVKEEAHTERMAHPVINDDTSQCEKCHSDQCNENIELFERTAGISNIFIATPHTKTTNITTQEIEKTSNWINIMEIVSILIIITIALAVYNIYNAKASPRGKS